jgi:hypothetical protein
MAMDNEEQPTRKRRATSPAMALRMRIRAELEPFYVDMGEWNGELAALTEHMRHNPKDRAKHLADLSRLRRAIQLGRDRALRHAEQLAAGHSFPIIEDADRASALLLKRVEEAMG